MRLGQQNFLPRMLLHKIFCLEWITQKQEPIKIKNCKFFLKHKIEKI